MTTGVRRHETLCTRGGTGIKTAEVFRRVEHLLKTWVLRKHHVEKSRRGPRSWWVWTCVVSFAGRKTAVRWRFKPPLEGRVARADGSRSGDCRWVGLTGCLVRGFGLGWPTCGLLHRVRTLWGRGGGRWGDPGAEGGGVACGHDCDGGGDTCRWFLGV